MFKNILIPLDGSLSAECVLPHVVAIAKAFDAQCIIMNVIEQPIDALGSSKSDPLDWYLRKTEAMTYLDGVKARLEKCLVSVTTLLMEGRTIEQINKTARAHNIDLLIVSDCGSNATNGWSVNRIGQQTRTSLLIIRAEDAPTVPLGELVYSRLLVPLDGSRRAGAALPFATAIVQAYYAELILVQVVKKPEMARYMPLTQEDAALMNRFVDRNQEEGNKYLEQLRAVLPISVKTHLLVSDNVAVTLQSFGEQEQIDLLILSAHGYSGEAKWAYGSVTNRFITDGTLPLLIIQDLSNEPLEVGRDDINIQQMER